MYIRQCLLLLKEPALPDSCKAATLNAKIWMDHFPGFQLQ